MFVLAQSPSAVSEVSAFAFVAISIVYLVLCWLVIRRGSSGELIGLGLLTTVASAGYGSLVLPAGPEIAHTMIRIAFLLVLGGLVQRLRGPLIQPTSQQFGGPVMNCSSKLFRDPRMLVIAGSVVVWFLVFPSDLEAVLVPVRSLISLISEILWLTTSISEWAYVLAAVTIVCWTWRGRARASEQPSTSV